MNVIVRRDVGSPVVIVHPVEKEAVVRRGFVVRTVSRMIVVMRKGTVTRVVCV